jgi:ribosomal protein S18 acetylase RimI-like enzyme
MDHAIRKAEPGDAEGIWAVLAPVLAAGETYALPRDMSRDGALAYWLAPEKITYVAEFEGRIAGTYYLRANQAGPGAHVANCGYVTAGWAQGQGLARAMCAHSLEVARAAGFRAMQFNLVVATNTRAVRLWQDMGFSILGTVPAAFAHPQHGYVDAHVMWRSLIG